MPTVDHEHHDLVLRVLVMGGASDSFASSLPLQDGELALGDIQGFRPRFLFSTFPLDPWSDAATAAAIEQFAAQADALVLTDALAEGTHYSSSAVEHLSRLLVPVKITIPAAIFGGPALTQEWETLSGRAPVVALPPSGENALVVVKALTKVLLRSTLKSTPPPPATGPAQG
jgi:hypothetical protein